MAEILSGSAALDAMNDEGKGGGSDKDFSKFNVGNKYVVKVLGKDDFFGFFSYGIYSKDSTKRVNSFVAKNPSKKSAKGYPVENLTPWDKAWKYHADRSEKFGDDESNEAYKYKPELRYAYGFFDLDSGERIVIDVSKNQAKTFRTAILKYEKKLSKIAFEVSKESGGAVSLTPVIDMDEDLTDKQRANFNKAPEEFNIEDFHGILYEASEEEMIESLTRVGFDVALIGYQPKQKADNGGDEDAEPIPGEDDLQDEDLPF